MKELICRYSWKDIDNYIVIDNVTGFEFICYEKRKCIDDANREFEPKFLIDSLCNGEFIRWAISTSNFFAKNISFKDDYSATDYSRKIYAPANLLKGDMQIDLVKINSKYISKIPDNILTDEIIYYTLSEHVFVLCAIPNRRRTKEICEFAININGNALRYVPYKLKTFDLCLQAVVNNPSAIKYVPFKVLNDEFLETLNKANILINECDVKYICECLNINKFLKEGIVSIDYMNNLQVINELDNNIFIRDMQYFFTSPTIKFLNSLNIFTVKQLLLKSSEHDFIYQLGNNKSLLNEIYGTIRILNCKYFDEDPLIEETDDSISLNTLFSKLGYNVKTIKSLERSGIFDTTSSFFKFIRTNNCKKVLMSLKNLGEGRVTQILKKAEVVIDYHDRHNKFIIDSDKGEDVNLHTYSSINPVLKLNKK